MAFDACVFDPASRHDPGARRATHTEFLTASSARSGPLARCKSTR